MTRDFDEQIENWDAKFTTVANHQCTSYADLRSQQKQRIMSTFLQIMYLFRYDFDDHYTGDSENLSEARLNVLPLVRQSDWLINRMFHILE